MIQQRQTVRAILAANATTAPLEWVRASSARSQAPTAVSLLARDGMAARAPWMSIFRKHRLPRLVMPRSFGLPPVVTGRGAAKTTVLFYSTYGTNHGIALQAANALEAAGAEVRLRRCRETAPRDVVEGQEAWRDQLQKMQDIPEVRLDDMEWADGYFISVPTRFGVPASQFRTFVDTLGPLWQSGALANKAVTATTFAQNPHGGQETTIKPVYVTAMHWSSIIVAPGYADPIKSGDGGNPSVTPARQVPSARRESSRWHFRPGGWWSIPRSSAANGLSQGGALRPRGCRSAKPPIKRDSGPAFAGAFRMVISKPKLAL